MGQAMNNLPLQLLKWRETSVSASARTPMHSYEVIATENNKFYVKKVRLETQKLEEVTGFDTAQAAKDWCFNEHYAVKMQPYVKTDSITDIANWFKAAKPEPTIDDLCVQIGCHLEEVAELLEALGLKDYDTHEQLTIDADHFKNKSKWALMKLTKLNYEQRIAIVDACCDTNVTGTGIMQLLGGVDALGAQREVIRSNNSKMVDGKFEFDDNGKIAKPDSYREPDLTPFISTMQILHKRDK